MIGSQYALFCSVLCCKIVVKKGIYRVNMVFHFTDFEIRTSGNLSQFEKANKFDHFVLTHVVSYTFYILFVYIHILMVAHPHPRQLVANKIFFCVQAKAT